MANKLRRGIAAMLRRFYILRLIRRADRVVLTVRQREAQADFRALRLRLGRENDLHVLLLVQRIHRSKSYAN